MAVRSELNAVHFHCCNVSLHRNWLEVSSHRIFLLSVYRQRALSLLGPDLLTPSIWSFTERFPFTLTLFPLLIRFNVIFHLFSNEMSEFDLGDQLTVCEAGNETRVKLEHGCLGNIETLTMFGNVRYCTGKVAGLYSCIVP